jgi:hypothetical protein
MSDEQKREPVDNSHRDAGIAARDSKQDAKTDQVAEKAAEIVEEHEQDEAQNKTEATAPPESGDAPAQQAGKKPGVHQRIDELTKEKHDARRAAEDAQRERDHWREQALRAQQPKEQAQPAQAAETGEPTLESCDFDPVEFQRRWYQYQRTQEKQQEATQAQQRKFTEREAAFRAEHPDYDAVARNPALPITQQVAEIILETDDPPAVAYYLGQNPEEAAAIAQMTPHQIGRAIGRIEAKLSAPTPASEAPRQPEPKTVTKAPAPVTTLSGSPAVKKSYEEMSPKEYDAVRRKERAGQG